MKQENNRWTKAKNMGKPINIEYREGSLMLSPDKKYLFFTGDRTGNGDIYWVDAKVIEQLIFGTGL
jgi:Tol biopolymer transport system component